MLSTAPQGEYNITHHIHHWKTFQNDLECSIIHPSPHTFMHRLHTEALHFNDGDRTAHHDIHNMWMISLLEGRFCGHFSMHNVHLAWSITQICPSTAYHIHYRRGWRGDCIQCLLNRFLQLSICLLQVVIHDNGVKVCAIVCISIRNFLHCVRQSLLDFLFRLCCPPCVPQATKHSCVKQYTSLIALGKAFATC